MMMRWSAIALLALAGAARAQTTFQGLGFVAGSTESYATAVSANGKTVVGYAPVSGPVAWRWKPADGMLTLNALSGDSFKGEPRAISDDGAVVAGTNYNGKILGWYWTQAGKSADIGVLHAGTAKSQAYGISGDGKVITGWSTNSSDQVAVTYIGGVLRSIGDIEGGTTSASGYAVDTTGAAIVGVGRGPSGRQAFRYAGGVMTGLEDVLGGPTESTALGVSSDGNTVVGFGANFEGRCGLVWAIGADITEIPDLPGGEYSATANAVSGNGKTVVGFVTTDAGREAFIWTKDLSGGDPVTIKKYLLDQDVDSVAGWTLTEATAVSRDGSTIVGNGIDPEGHKQAWKVLVERDTDGDGLYDSWESEGEGIDSDGDGKVDLDLYALGARLDSLDLFVEVDAMSGRAPSGFSASAADKAAIASKDLELTGTTLDMTVASFARAPLSNPDGTTGIRLHIKLDKTDLPLTSWATSSAGDEAGVWAFYDAVKTSNFGTPSKPKVLEAEKKAYRYCVFADRIFNDGTSGLAELPGNDCIVALGLWDPPGGTVFEQAGTFMHELGHTLGLRHGGKNHTNYKPNYKSVMNYMWQNPNPALAAWWVLDYSREELPTINEGGIEEANGFGLATGTQIFVGPPEDQETVAGSGPVDLDDDGSKDDTVARNVNAVYEEDTGLDFHAGANDWPAVQLPIGTTGDFADGVHQTSTPTIDIDHTEQTALEAIPPVCRPDCNGDSRLNVNDFICFQAAWKKSSPYGDFNGDGKWNVNDFIAFQAAFRGGCP